MQIDIQPGTVVDGKYRVDRIIGEGGMGVVYAATQLQLDRRVALKFLLRAKEKDPQTVERFAREARAAVQIESEHVARVLDVGELSGGIPYIVMEYLEGQGLDDLLLHQGRLPFRVAVDYILQAAEALAEAHSYGIVHRDIKPANLFLTRRLGRTFIKVLDFGICKLPMTTQNVGITHESAIMGSPGYMSPEQMMGAGAVDPRTDVWALGAVLYQMLGGRPPFLADTLPSLIAIVLHQPHVSLRTLAPEVPPQLSSIIDACLHKDPIYRPPSMLELAQALAPFGPTGSTETALRIAQVLGANSPANGVDAMAHTTAGSRKSLFVKDGTLSPTSTPSQRGASRRNTALLVALVGSVIVGTAIGTVVVLRPGVRHAAAIASAPNGASAVPVRADPSSIAPPPDTALPPGTGAVLATANDADAAAPIAPPPGPSGPHGHVPKPKLPPAASASAAPSAAPACQVISYLDDHGDKHFKQVCP